MFIDLDKEKFENCKVLKLNCSFCFHDSKESVTFDNYLFLLKKGICVGAVNFDTADKFHKCQLMLGYYTFNALKFRILTFHNTGYNWLLAKNDEGLFKGRFFIESFTGGKGYGLCEIKTEIVNLNQKEYSEQKEQIKNCITELENTDSYAGQVFEQIEECYKPAEYRQIITREAEKYKDRPAEICIKQVPKCYI